MILRKLTRSCYGGGLVCLHRSSTRALTTQPESTQRLTNGRRLPRFASPKNYSSSLILRTKALHPETLQSMLPAFGTLQTKTFRSLSANLTLRTLVRERAEFAHLIARAARTLMLKPGSCSIACCAFARYDRLCTSAHLLYV